MKYPIEIQHLISAQRESCRRLSWRHVFLITRLACVAACLGLSATAKAACEQGCDTSKFNTFLGDMALLDDTTGQDNVAVGEAALLNNTTGNDNTGVGSDALVANKTGLNDTAIGYGTLNTATGSENTAVGAHALIACSTGNNNTATGADAMGTGTVTGNNNTANGYQALYSDATGGSNTATGVFSLYFNTSGNFNTATGRGALYKNTASNNVATGYQALNNNTSGTFNTSVGTKALAANTTSSYNTALGYQALNTNTGQENTALGANALFGATGSNNIAIGSAAGSFVTSGNFNIEIGSVGGTDSNTIRLGTVGQQNSAYIARIYGVTVAGGIGVIVDSNGRLGTSTSSARYKEAIQPMEKASEAILSLQPVAFRYKKELDPKAIPQFGLVAEQVEQVDPDLVARDDQGKPYSVRYEAVNAMLLNEFLKAYRRIEEQQRSIVAEGHKAEQQETTINELKSAMIEQEKQIKALTSAVQKVSHELELAKPTVRVAVNL